MASLRTGAFLAGACAAVYGYVLWDIGSSVVKLWTQKPVVFLSSREPATLRVAIANVSGWFWPMVIREVRVKPSFALEMGSRSIRVTGLPDTEEKVIENYCSHGAIVIGHVEHESMVAGSKGSEQDIARTLWTQPGDHVEVTYKYPYLHGWRTAPLRFRSAMLPITMVEAVPQDE